MATFDQLAADQRAIIEIVLRQDRSYEQIGEMLDLPPTRVRELARDALRDLAPFTAEFVDPQWRGQLADYVLGQQTGPEAQATRGHLKRSEPARIWAYSLIDALDDFFEEGDQPEIPVGEAGGRVPRSQGKAAAAASNGEAPQAEAAAAATRASAAGSPPARRRKPADSGSLSPAARSALMRRRILGGLAAAVIAAAIVIGAIAVFGGGGGKKKPVAASTAKKSASSAGKPNVQVIAQAILAPIGAQMKGSAGVARVVGSGRQYALLVQAKLPPSSGNKRYVIWLYNSPTKYIGVAAGPTDKNGNFSGGQALPNGWQNYHFVDVTYQSVAGKTPRHGLSVMRGPLTAPTTSSGTGSGTTTTP